MLTLIFLFAFIAADDLLFPASKEPVKPPLENDPVIEAPVDNEPVEKDPEPPPEPDPDPVTDPDPDPEPEPEPEPDPEPENRERGEKAEKILEKLLSVAKNELGYSPPGSRTKYAGYFDGGQSEWSAEFIAWCAAKTGEALSVQVEGAMFPWTDTVAGCFLWFIARDAYVEADGEFLPFGGDYVFLDDGGDGLIDRVGIVVKIMSTSVTGVDGIPKTETVITLISGDTPKTDNVTEKDLSLSSPSLVGFGLIE